MDPALSVTVAPAPMVLLFTILMNGLVLVAASMALWLGSGYESAATR